MIVFIAIVIPYTLGILLSIYKVKTEFYPRPGHIFSFVKRFGKYGCVFFWPFISLEEIIRKFKHGKV